MTDRPAGSDPRRSPRAVALLSALLLGLASLAIASIFRHLAGAHTDARMPDGRAGDRRGIVAEGPEGPMPAGPERPAGRTPSSSLRLLVPAYFHPSGPSLEYWSRLFEASARAPLAVVVNPHSGPGEAIEKAYADAISGASSRKILVLGYINTQYGARPPEAVKADVERWIRFYPAVRGFFFDAQASDADRLDYYVALARYARDKLRGAVIVTNPGTTCAEDYLSRSAADVACVFEQPEGFDGFSPPAWAGRYSAERLGAFPYHVDGEERMKASLRDAARKGIGYIYITDGKGENPWGMLPSYWEAEVGAVRRVNQRQAP